MERLIVLEVNLMFATILAMLSYAGYMNEGQPTPASWLFIPLGIVGVGFTAWNARRMWRLGQDS